MRTLVEEIKKNSGLEIAPDIKKAVKDRLSYLNKKVGMKFTKDDYSKFEIFIKKRKDKDDSLPARTAAETSMPMTLVAKINKFMLLNKLGKITGLNK
jgi:hypothetical protein